MPIAPILLIVLLFVVIVAVLALLKTKVGGGDATGPGNVYELSGPVLTKAERSFFGSLEAVVPGGVGLLAKVRLADIFQTKKGLDPSARTRANNRIQNKHVDFLLVRTSDLLPLAGVELDDASHGRRDRQSRDVFVDEVFRSGNLPLLRVPAQASYNLVELKAKLTPLLAVSDNPRT